ncbi:MAG: 4-hydroxy-tetrahydrodipicolinate synthase [Candidatus Marinimicrobia bacterium]|nr:4-hydroxy-tetrahydrodipicolinate synthase [Candidatus Neomarinimicrobiota bacterium]
MQIKGVWVPMITPFNEGEVDYKSHKNLIDHYIENGVDGIMPIGTTGEFPTVEEDEFYKLVEKTVEYIDARIPVFIGLGGNYTKKVIEKVKRVENYDIEGILSVVPYYNKPDQEGVYQHFKTIAENTDLNILLYNIPDRTGCNIENDTIFKLAQIENIIGVKDVGRDILQSMELLYNKPDNFSVLTGEDIIFYTYLVNGGDGGVLASSHVLSSDFVEIYNLVQDGSYDEALNKWKKLFEIIPTFFKAPNPAPLKYCLSELGLITSYETRSPLVEIPEELKRELDRVLENIQ